MSKGPPSPQKRKKPKYKVEIKSNPLYGYWWAVYASNGREVSWSGETYKRQSHAVKMAKQLFPSFPIE